MTGERRKIVYRNGRFQLLKPKENGTFHEYGEQKSVKSISDLIGIGRYDFSIEEGAREILNSYRKQRDLPEIRTVKEGQLVLIAENRN